MTPIDFIKTAVRDRRVGAVSSSSKYAIERILKEIPRGTKYIVEYGAGDGIVTREILRHMPQDGKLFAVEVIESFLPYLRAIDDPRLTIIHGDVIAVSGRLYDLGAPRIDVVVSGIPFTFLSREERIRVVSGTQRALAPGGRFVVYQFRLLVLPVLKKVFRRVAIGFEPRNFPPYFVMRAEK